MVRAVATTREGRRIHVDPDDPRALTLLRSGGSVHPTELSLWRRVLLAETWDLVVDVGAGWGETLVRPDLPRGADVVALEPALARLPHLRRTLDANDLRRARVRSDAVGRSPAGGDPTARVVSLDEVVGPRERSFCVRVGPGGLARDLVRGAGAVLRYEVPWVVLLPLDEPGASDGWWDDLAEQRDLLLPATVGHGLLHAGRRADGPLADLVRTGRARTGWCLLVAPSIADALSDGLV